MDSASLPSVSQGLYFHCQVRPDQDRGQPPTTDVQDAHIRHEGSGEGKEGAQVGSVV